MSEKKIDDKVLDKNDLNELYVLLSKINSEVKQDMWFSKQKKYKTKQWREFMTDWKMNFDQRLLNDKLTLNNWTTKKDPGTLTCLIEPLKIIIEHDSVHENKEIEKAVNLCAKVLTFTKKTIEDTMNKDDARINNSNVSKCAKELHQQGYAYGQPFGAWLLALSNHLPKMQDQKKQKSMTEQFKKDYHSTLGQIILHRTSMLHKITTNTLIKLPKKKLNYLIENLKTTQIGKSLVENYENGWQDDFFSGVAVAYFLPAFWCQCDKCHQLKFKISKYNSFRYAFKIGNFNDLFDVVFYYLILNLQNQTTNNSNKDKPKS